MKTSHFNDHEINEKYTQLVEAFKLVLKELIQTNYRGKYFVSTSAIHYTSKSPVSSTSFYYETRVWKWNKKKDKRGKMVAIHDSGSNLSAAMNHHFQVCESLGE